MMEEEKGRCAVEEGSGALVMLLLIYLKSWELPHAC